MGGCIQACWIEVEGTVRSSAGVDRFFKFLLEATQGSALAFDSRMLHTAIP